jgi:hypothetical protein
MSLHDLLGLGISGTGLLLIVGFLRYMFLTRHDDSLTSDCRDGLHPSCLACGCFCHANLDVFDK